MIENVQSDKTTIALSPCLVANELNCYLNGECSTPPPVDQSQCGFGKWLFTERKVWLHAQSYFSDIDELHQQLHSLWNELFNLHDEGFEDEALARLDEQYHLRDELINKMHDMLRCNH